MRVGDSALVDEGEDGNEGQQSAPPVQGDRNCICTIAFHKIHVLPRICATQKATRSGLHLRQRDAGRMLVGLQQGQQLAQVPVKPCKGFVVKRSQRLGQDA